MWMIWPLICAIVLTSIISIHWIIHILMTQNDIVVHDNHFQKNHCIMCNDNAIYHIYPIHHIMTSLVPRVTLRPTVFFFRQDGPGSHLVTRRILQGWAEGPDVELKKDESTHGEDRSRDGNPGWEFHRLKNHKISMAVTKKWSCDMIIVYFFGCGSLMKMMVPVTSRDHRHHCWTNPQKFLRFYRET